MRQVVVVLSFVAAWLLASRLGHAQAPGRSSRVQATELVVSEDWHDTHNQFVVTATALVVNRTFSDEHGRQETRYKRALTPGERRWLLAPFDPVHLSRIQPVYEGTYGPTDGFSCDVHLCKETYCKTTRFIRCYFAPLRTFSDRLNALLPEDFQFSYEDQHR